MFAVFCTSCKTVGTNRVHSNKSATTSNLCLSKPVCTSNVHSSKLDTTSDVRTSKPVYTSNFNTRQPIPMKCKKSFLSSVFFYQHYFGSFYNDAFLLIITFISFQKTNMFLTT